MTDERMGERLWEGTERLTPGESGIVFRHYASDPETRSAIGRRIAAICRSRGFTLAVAGDEGLARELGAQLVHNPAEPPVGMPFSKAVHSLEEAQAARAAGAALVFVSPLYPTRSHPGAKTLGKDLALKIARAAGVPAIALGGMDERRFARVRRDGFYGFAAIDAWIRT